MILGGAGRRQRVVRTTGWLLALLGLVNLFLFDRQETQVDEPATRGQARASDSWATRPRTPGPDDCPFPDRKLKPSLRDRGLNPQGYREYLAADGSVLIHIPPGDYLGAKVPDARGWTGRKTRKIHLEGYYIGKFEVTNAQFARFVRETGYAPFVNVWETYAKKSGDDFPVVYASWRAASAYCKWAGLRLPTIREWERAARGTDGRTYPWGQEWDANRSNNFKLADQKRKSWRADFSAGRGPLPTGLFPEGASPCGALDMIGNVAEWCSDQGKAGDPSKDPHGFGGWYWRMLCGGSWDDRPARCTLTPPVSVKAPDYGSTYAWGFRVARSE